MAQDETQTPDGESAGQPDDQPGGLAGAQAALAAGRPGDALQQAQATEFAALDAGDAQTAAGAAFLAGQALLPLGRAEDALAAFQRSLARLRNIGDTENAAVVQQTIDALRAQMQSPALKAHAAAQAGELTQAEALASAALDGDIEPAQQLELLIVRGQARAGLRRFDDALADLDRASALAAELPSGQIEQHLAGLRQHVAHKQTQHGLAEASLDTLLSADVPLEKRVVQLAMRLNAQLEAGDLEGAAATADAGLPLVEGADEAGMRLMLWLPTIQLRARRGDADGARSLLAKAREAAEAVPRAQGIVEQLAAALGEQAEASADER